MDSNFVKNVKKDWATKILKYFCFVIFGSFLIFFLMELNRDNYEEINLIGNVDIDNGQNIDFAFSPPSSRDKAIFISIEKDEDSIINFDFKNPIKFNGISLFFIGNLSNQVSYGAKKISVYYQNNNDEMTLLNKIDNNRNSLYEFFFKQQMKTSRIQLKFSDPFYYDDTNIKPTGLVAFNDLKIFKRVETSFWDNFKNTLMKYSHSLFAYTFYYLLFFILLFIPGYVFMKLLRSRLKLSFDNEIALIFGPIFAISVMFISATVYVMTDIKLFLYTYPFAAIILIVIFFKTKLYKELIYHKTMLIFMLLALLLIFFVIGQRDYLYNLDYIGKYLDNQNVIPVDGYIGYFVDNLFPWRIARHYFNNYLLSDPVSINLLNGTTLYDRTPLLPIITTVVMNFFGEGHFVFQRFLEVLAVLFVGAFYVLFSRYYSKKVAVITMFLVLLNVPIFLTAINAEIYYKFFSIFPIVLATIVFFFGKKYVNIGIGILTTIAFLIHPSTLIYSLTIIFLYFLKYRFNKELIFNTIPVISMLTLAVVSWYVMPKMISGSEIVNENINSFYFDEIVAIDKNLYITKLVNFAFLFIPNILLVGENSANIFTASGSFNYAFFRYSFLSNITPFFFILLLIYIVRNFKKHILFISLGIMPMFIYWLFYLNQFNFFYYYGGAYFILYPFVIPVLLAFIVNNLMRERIYLRSLFFITYIIFMAFNLYYISGVFIKIKYISAVTDYFLWLILSIYVIISLIAFFNITGWYSKILNRITG